MVASARAAWGAPGLPWLGDAMRVGGASVAAPLTPAAALALTATMRACSLLSDSATNAPPSIYKREDRGGRVLVRGTAAARALALLPHADAEAFAFSTCLAGNGFLEIERDGNGAPTRLRSLATWRMEPLVDESRRVFYRVAADSTIGEGAERIIPAGDVVHAQFRVTGPNTLWGVPPVASCSQAFGLAMQSREVLRALYSNLAFAGGVLVTENKIDASLARRLQSEWDQNYGRGGIGRTAVLSNGLDWKSITFKATDAQLLEQIDATTSDIARAYGIPRTFLETDSHVTYQSAGESVRALYALALRGFCARLADALGQKLLSRADRANGWQVAYDLSDLLLLPGKETSDYFAALVSNGIATPNEVRNELGWTDIGGGDKLRGPAAAPAPKAAPDDTGMERRQLVAYRQALERWHAELQVRLRRLDDAAPRLLAGLVEHNATLRPTLPTLADVTTWIAHEQRAHVEAQLDEPEVIDLEQ